MWSSVLLYLLEIIITQAEGQETENSTQMYYSILTIDVNALALVPPLLKQFASSSSTLRIDGVEKTTTCRPAPGGSNCRCEQGHRWTHQLCQSHRCCGGGGCVLPAQMSSACIAENSVFVAGSITLRSQQDFDCLADKSTAQYQQCSERLHEEMKSVYSTLRRFHYLTVRDYRLVAGTVLADLQMRIDGSVGLDLGDKTESLCAHLSALLALETLGVVRLHLPPSLVCHHSSQLLRCTTEEDLQVTPTWHLHRDGEVYDITNGTQSRVTSRKQETSVAIKHVSKLWTGLYSCVYAQTSDKSQCKISHKAIGEMDISLLPDITVSPSFPLCQGISESLAEVHCEIEPPAETFTVAWTSRGNPAQLVAIPPSSSEGMEVYTAVTVVSCSQSTPTPQITCTFKNRCNQEASATAEIHIITENDQFCEAEGDWQVTKAGHTAVLKCSNAAGRRRRSCHEGNTTGTWDAEVSECVNDDVEDTLQMANIADSGLNSLQKNAARVLFRLNEVTNDSQQINSVSNLKASVQVLAILSVKGNLQTNDRTADDFLASSSNLLEDSLENSWTSTSDQGNQSLAETYLQSVEHLIQQSSITGSLKKKNVEMVEQNCSGDLQCSNTVFNVTVRLQGGERGTLKSAGFQQLQGYLPNNDTQFKPNSIVVSAAAEEEQSDSVSVKIHFPLLKPRPRNVELQCVSWDNNSRSWSPRGCQWAGPSSEGHCTCRHFSSFAILMSRYPLDLPCISQITFVGLSVSVASLIVSLAIELALWRTVIKTKTSHLRHTAHTNISLCLLVADCCFLASSKPSDLSPSSCLALVVLKHFCYLSMFFWMLCLSATLLHQTIFLFHTVSRAVYLRFSMSLGYGCPLLIVLVTIGVSGGFTEGKYFSRETCWLTYSGLMSGSIYAFVIPAWTIIFVNVFAMLVVIMKLLDQPASVATSSSSREKRAVLTTMRSVVLLTPVFGLTWILGFAVMLVDLTSGALAYVVHYAFTLLNVFQGLFILLATSVADKLTREALLNCLKKSAPKSSGESSTKIESI